LVGVELGVNRGMTSELFLANLNIKKLYVVDPYVQDEIYGDADERKKEALGRLSYYSDVVDFIYKSSVDAVDLVPSGLDFVFIDGEHTYETVFKRMQIDFKLSNCEKAESLYNDRHIYRRCNNKFY
jgi:hypothetical protein